MSFSGSDDTPICDVCNTWFVYDALVPWPLPGADRWPLRDLFVMCRECVQNFILEASRGPARMRAHESACRWQAYQALLRDAETAVRDAYRRIADQSRRAWNARHDAEAARRRQQEDELAAQFPARAGRPGRDHRTQLARRGPGHRGGVLRAPAATSGRLRVCGCDGSHQPLRLPRGERHGLAAGIDARLAAAWRLSPRRCPQAVEDF
jgi:hypothetical protein